MSVVNRIISPCIYGYGNLTIYNFNKMVYILIEKKISVNITYVISSYSYPRNENN